MYICFLYDITWGNIVSTQVEPVMNDFGVQCIIEQFDYVDKMKHLNQIMRATKVNIIKVRANLMITEGRSNCSTGTPAGTVFIVYWP